MLSSNVLSYSWMRVEDSKEFFWKKNIVGYASIGQIFEFESTEDEKGLSISRKGAKFLTIRDDSEKVAEWQVLDKAAWAEKAMIDRAKRTSNDYVDDCLKPIKKAMLTCGPSGRAAIIADVVERLTRYYL